MTAKIDGTNGLLQQYDYQVLTTAFTYTFAAGTTVLVINPAGTLATGTITMPAAPADGMTITFSSTKQITALTLSGNTGQTVVSAATLLPANQATTYVYRLSNTSWYPMVTVPGVMVNGTQYYRLDSAYVGSNATGAQSIFNVGVTLSASTVYEFEAVCAFSKTAGTTSHTFALGFGGTASINNIAYQAYNSLSATAFSTVEQTTTASFIQVATSSVLTGASTGAFRSYVFLLKGTVSINAGGTFIPQYTLSAAPGGAYSTAIGSYIKIYPLGASGAANNIGSWA
tara:strand:+ start:1176 stop:2030 length:855 start_codon:yes stop_codon:yes gene_type:complete